MSAHHIWYFCRQCSYRGEFLAEKDDEINCPKCHDSGKPESKMVGQDIQWLMDTNTDLSK